MTAPSRARALVAARAGNLRRLRADRRAQCWWRANCLGVPVPPQWKKDGEKEPFSVCLDCQAQIAGRRGYAPVRVAA